MENSSDHKREEDKQEDQENHQRGQIRNLENVKIKGESYDGNEIEIEIDGDEEGFKTPTKKEHRIAVDIRQPPAAPKKPKAKLMKRRRPSRRTLFQVSTADIELLFPAVVAKEKDNNNNNKDSVSISNDSAANININTNNNKVNTSNYTTTTTSSPPLMSLR